MEWNDRFMAMLKAQVERFHERPTTAVGRFFLQDELALLAEIGNTPEEIHAYIKEYATKGDPSPSTILLIANVRRSFFLTSQRGISGNAAPVKAKDLPAEYEVMQDIPYLPRIIRKAEAKLYGTLDSSLMYYDEKDRVFLRDHGNIHPADFLNLVWVARGDKQKVLVAVMDAVKNASTGPEPPAESDIPFQPELPLAD